MFIIMHASPRGAESYYEAAEVTHVSYREVTALSGFSPILGRLTFPDGIGHRSFDEGGIVRVMNAEGVAIAKYDLGGWAERAAS